MNEKQCFTLKTAWFAIMFINFIFGILGIIVCTLKLHTYVEDEEVRASFFKLSMLFALINLIVSVMLLVSVLKNNHKYAFLYASLSFLSLFAATVHLESHTTQNVTFLIMFTVFALLCIAWFCVYGAYRVLLQDNLNNAEV